MREYKQNIKVLEDRFANELDVSDDKRLSTSEFVLCFD